MFFHPDTVMMLAAEHRRELIAEADRFRLLKTALRNRSENARRDKEVVSAQNAAWREQRAPAALPSAGNLAGCGSRGAAPAR
jgi:hypothetical protein